MQGFHRKDSEVSKTRIFYSTNFPNNNVETTRPPEPSTGVT